MPKPSSELPLNELLRYTEWIRPLAIQVLQDADLAEDVVQETYIAAWKSAPRDPHHLRRWLRVTARNFSLKRLQERHSRRGRECKVATEEALPGAGDVAARAEAHREVVEAVMRLREPYRSVVLLRFFENLPPRVISERLSIPNVQVRSHLKRGLDDLRLMLQKEYGQDWRAPLLLLVHWKAVQHAPMPAATLHSTFTAKALAFPFFLCWVGMLGWWLWTAPAKTNQRTPVEFAGARPSVEMDSRTEIEIPESVGKRVSLSNVNSEPALPAPALKPVNVHRGRVVWMHSRQAAEFTQIEGQTESDESVLVLAQCDAGGEFELNREQLKGVRRVRGRWGQYSDSQISTPMQWITPWREVDTLPEQMTLTLNALIEERSFSVAFAGRVVREDGLPLNPGTRVRAYPKGKSMPGEDWEIDFKTGHFLIPSMSVQVVRPSTYPKSSVITGLSPQLPLGRSAGLFPGRLPLNETASTWIVEVLSPDRVIGRSGFITALPGQFLQSLRIVLPAGSKHLTVRFVDASNPSLPIPNALLQMREGRSLAWAGEWVAKKMTADENGLVRVSLTDDLKVLRLRGKAPGYVPWGISGSDIHPISLQGETAVTLQRGSTVRGYVENAIGRRVGAEVRVRAELQQPDASLMPFEISRLVMTATDGSFLFDDLSPGVWLFGTEELVEVAGGGDRLNKYPSLRNGVMLEVRAQEELETTLKVGKLLRGQGRLHAKSSLGPGWFAQLCDMRGRVYASAPVGESGEFQILSEDYGPLWLIFSRNYVQQGVFRTGFAYYPEPVILPRDRMDVVLQDTRVEFLVRTNANRHYKLQIDRDLCHGFLTRWMGYRERLERYETSIVQGLPVGDYLLWIKEGEVTRALDFVARLHKTTMVDTEIVTTTSE